MKYQASRQEVQQMAQETAAAASASAPGEQTAIMTSGQAQALEAQIASQILTAEQASRYFQTGSYGSVLGIRVHNYATSGQIVRLSHKSSRAVKGLNPWAAEDAGENYYSTAEKAEPLQIPESAVCEFCGKKLEYLAVLNHVNRIYEWEVERWSGIPLRCGCRKAKEKQAALDAEEKRLEAEEKRRREDEAKKARVEKQMAHSGMKARFLSRTFANFCTDTPERSRACRISKEYADNFTAHSANGDGLYIEGTFGTGKTHLAAAIAIQLMEQGRNVIFRTADDLLRDIKATFDENGREEQKVLARLKECDLLVIDDIGKEMATDWSTAQLYAVINDRYECQKPVIITTNFNEDDLIAVESPRGVGEHRIRAILSRLHEMCMLLTMNWQDWRGTR